MGASEDLLRAVEAIGDVTENGKITCPKALALAKRLNVSPVVIGKAANETGIKITGCQLGCFGKDKED